MPDSILVFTFSPVQKFIVEARRTADLFAGSQILVRLARAAAEAIQAQGGTLVYPTDLTADVPNRLVARVPAGREKGIAEGTEASPGASVALLQEWEALAATAKEELMSRPPHPDDVWGAIWSRQVSRLWEIYWASASLDGRSYAEAYDLASRAVDAAKRPRAFLPSEEEGLKDTLSGRRQALRTKEMDAKEYWVELGQGFPASQLRPQGRERLDAIGAVKRFGSLDQNLFLSTSSIASLDFLEQARPHIAAHRDAIQQLEPFPVRPDSDSDWPYDGDLLYLDGLTAKRLSDSYGIDHVDEAQLEVAIASLRDLYKQTGRRPATYYAIMVFDGDDIGKQVSACLSSVDPEDAHRTFSQSLTTFSAQVKPIVVEHKGTLVYNGGDDVLALFPLATALPAGQRLADQFAETVGGTASAGIAIVHHTYPLGTALRMARVAECIAKQVPDKAAVCVKVIKRNGEAAQIRSKWDDLGSLFNELVGLFTGDAHGNPIGSGLAFEVRGAAYALPSADEKWKSEAKRLIKRQSDARHPACPNASALASRLQQWASRLPEQATEVGDWLVFARFVAHGGDE